MNAPENIDDSSTRRRQRRYTAFGVGAGLLGGGAIGLLMAVPTITSATTDDTSGDTTTTVLEETNDDTDTATTDTATTDTMAGDEVEATAPGSRVRSLLQDLVDDGTITAEQADAVAAHLAANRAEHEGHGRRRGPGFDGEVLAALLGIDVETLRSELRAGKTVADIATDHGVDPQTVVDALVEEAQSHLELSVDNGRLTQEEADARLDEISDRISDRVDNGRPSGD